MHYIIIVTQFHIIFQLSMSDNEKINEDKNQLKLKLMRLSATIIDV